MTIKDIMEIITGFIGSFGFALLYNIRGKKLVAAAVGGLMSWALFIVLGWGIPDEAIRYFIVALTLSVYAEIMARILKTPTTTFIITSLIPLIPGSSLYYTMSHAVSGETELFSEFGIRTIHYILGITCGISIIWSIWYMVQKIMILRLNKNHGEDI